MPNGRANIGRMENGCLVLIKIRGSTIGSVSCNNLSE